VDTVQAPQKTNKSVLTARHAPSVIKIATNVHGWVLADNAKVSGVVHRPLE